MQRDRDSNRSKKWEFRNSLKNQGCVNYVRNLCFSFGIKDYFIDTYQNDLALFIKKDNLAQFILALDIEQVRLQSYRRSYNNPTKHSDTATMHFEYDTCWKKGIEWVAKQL